MSLPRRVAWNTIAQSAARVVTLSLALLTTALLTRHFGVSGYGVYVTVTVYVPFFALFFDAGLTTFVVRSLSTDDQLEVFEEALGLRLAFALPAMALAFGMAALLYGGASEAVTRNAIAVGLPIILFTSLSSALTALFQARLQMDRSALAEIVGQVTGAALIGAVVATDRSIYVVVAAAVVSTAVNASLLWLLVRRIVAVRPRFDPGVWRQLVAQALPLGLAVMIATIYFRADAVLLSILKGSHAVGIYGVAYRLLEAIIAFAGFFYASIFPLLSQAASRRDLPNLREVTQRAFDFLVVAAVPVVLGTLVAAPEIVRVLAGDEFDAAVTPLRIVIASVGFTFVNGLFSYVLIALRRQRAVLYLGLVTLAFNLALNLVLIPRYSYTAAASVATASEAVGFVAMLVLVRRIAGFNPRLEVAAKAALAGGLMVAALVVTPSNLAALIAVGAVTYGLALLLLRIHVSLELRELLGSGR